MNKIHKYRHIIFLLIGLKAALGLAQVRDSAYYAALVDKAYSLASSNPDSALLYYRELDSFSRSGNNEAFLLEYYSRYSWALANSTLLDSALSVSQRALDISRRRRDTVEMGYAHASIALAYSNKSYYQSALQNYFTAIDLLEKSGHSEGLCRFYSNISGCYYPLKMYDKCVEFEKKNLDCILPGRDTPRLRNAYFNMGLTLKELKEYDSAALYYRKSDSLNVSNTDRILDCRLHYARAALLNVQARYPEAIPIALQGIERSRLLNFESGVALCMAELGKAYLHSGKVTDARRYLAHAVSISQSNNLGEELLNALDPIRFAEAAGGDMNSSAAYDRMWRRLTDSIFNQLSSANLQELESRFGTERKENEIRRLQSEGEVQQLSLQRKNVLNLLLGGGVLAVGVISALLYRNYRQKQHLDQQRIIELETENRLMATEAVLKGEEKERERIAKDLHDGLGGMLSGIKYAFQNMKGNLVMTPANQQSFDRGLDMLDTSIQEMRRVAHNMMPEALVKFGLDVALRDFCSDISRSGALQVNYQSIGIEGMHIDQTVAITLYRVVQELINNSIKHAAARQAIVQLAKNNDQLAITVEDDGKGMDTGNLSNYTHGIGWRNIRHRIEFLRGRIDLRSEPGKGVSVHIELTL